MKAVFFRSGFNYDRDVASSESAFVPLGDSLTVQEQAEDADINTIVRRFGLTGQLPENIAIPRDGDFTTITDYHGALNIVAAADSAFAEMPANVRARFDNNAGKFMDFCHDPKNRDEALALGLLADNLPAPAAASPQAVSPAGAALDAPSASPSVPA